jgi:Ras family protein T1
MPPPGRGGGGRSVAIAVVGDAGTGKTSLISSAVTETFSDAPPPTLPPARFPAELLNSPDDLGELLVVDTSSRPEGAAATEAAVRAAAAVVLCIDASRPSTLERLRSHWLPEVARLNPGAPVVVAVCKDDRSDRADMGQLREVRGFGGVIVLRQRARETAASAGAAGHACVQHDAGAV